jgi:septal ring factor EnvC (AmiA/AmiB activator)
MFLKDKTLINKIKRLEKENERLKQKIKDKDIVHIAYLKNHDQNIEQLNSFIDILQKDLKDQKDRMKIIIEEEIKRRNEPIKIILVKKRVNEGED